jgi:type III secretion system YscD/HrpQ family protein
MAGYLVAEEGPLAGLVITFEEGTEWILGRDPDESTMVLEDPMVSRKHVICHLTPEGFTLENLSSVNPATQNGKVITEEVLLKEGDILEIGSTFFRFTEKNPSFVEEKEEEDTSSPVLFEEDSPLSSLDLEGAPSTRWLLKVISGPNTGAEFTLSPNTSYILGKDPTTCDVVFYDLSVSREHAKMQVLENEALFIEDLNSRNGTLINGEPIVEAQEIFPQDLIALGTTSFLMIDRHQVHETILSSVVEPPKEEEKPTILEEELLSQKKTLPKKSWKDLVIPTKHLAFGALFVLFILGLTTASLSLFKSKEVLVHKISPQKVLEETFTKFPSVQFSFNANTGKLFLTGHVLTATQKQELFYTLSTLPFITSTDDTVVIDELVWQNINAVLQANPSWQAVSLHSPTAGKFVLRGYVQTAVEGEELQDYLNQNFPYLDLLQSNVNVADLLTIQIEGLLIQGGFMTVQYQLLGGDLLLTGTVDKKRTSDFEDLVKKVEDLSGILSVKNYVFSMGSGNSTINLSQKYKISGFSSGNNDEQFAIINAKIFAPGDTLDGMEIIAIEPEHVLLEKDGLKFRIDYNLQ